MGEWLAYDGTLLETSCPVPEVYIYHVEAMINIWDNVSIFIDLPWMWPHTGVFEQRIG